MCLLRVSDTEIWPGADILFYYVSGLLWVQQSGGEKSQRKLLWCTRPFLSKSDEPLQEQERPYRSSFGWAFTSHKGELSTLSLSCEVSIWLLFLSYFFYSFPPLLCSILSSFLFIHNSSLTAASHSLTLHPPIILLSSVLSLHVLLVKLCFKYMWVSLITVHSTVCCIQCPLSPRQGLPVILGDDASAFFKTCSVSKSICWTCCRCMLFLPIFILNH